MAKLKAGRNIILVLALFVLTGVLVVVVRTARTPPLIEPEPEALQRARLSPNENGYFVLHEALKGLKPVAPVNQVSASDFERGPKAELLDVYLEEDAPEIDAAIEGSRHVVEAAHRALEMPYLLVPVDWQEVRKDPGHLYGGDYFQIYICLRRLVLVAVEDAKKGDIERALQAMVDSYRLCWRLVGEYGMTWAASGTPLFQRVELVRQCPPEFQERLGGALVELKREWRPSTLGLDTELRMLDIQGLWIAKEAYHGLQNAQIFFAFAKAKRALAGKYDALREAAGYTMKEYRQWAAQNAELANAMRIGYVGFQIEHICQANTDYLLELDAMCAVLAIEKYRRDTGSYPESLDQLVPEYVAEVPQDPMCDGPFIYRREGNDYRLYTLGHGCEDDGGQRYNSRSHLIHLPQAPRGTHRD